MRLSTLAAAALALGMLIVGPTARAQQTLASREQAQQTIFAALDGATFSVPGSVAGAQGNYKGQTSHPCRTLYQLSMPAYVSGGVTTPAKTYVFGVDWSEVKEIVAEPGEPGRIRVVRKSGTEWFSIGGDRRTRFIAGASYLMRACAIPERQSYHSDFVSYSDGSYKCTFTNPANLSLTIFPDGKVAATYESRKSYSNATAVLTIQVDRNSDGEAITRMVAEVQSPTPINGPLGEARLVIDGSVYTGFSASTGYGQRAGQPVIYTAGASLIQGGANLFSALVRARSVKLQMYYREGSKNLHSEIVFDVAGLSDVPSYLRRSNWSCIDPANLGFDPKTLEPWLQTQPLPNGWGVKYSGIDNQDLVFIYTADVRSNPASASLEGANFFRRDICKDELLRASIARGTRMRADTVYIEAGGKRAVRGALLACPSRTTE